MKSIFTLIKFHAKSRNFIPYSRRINRGEPTIVSPPYSSAAESHRFIFLRFVRIREEIVICHFSFLVSFLSLSPFFLSFYQHSITQIEHRASNRSEINFDAYVDNTRVYLPESKTYPFFTTMCTTRPSSTHARCIITVVARRN